VGRLWRPFGTGFQGNRDRGVDRGLGRLQEGVPLEPRGTRRDGLVAEGRTLGRTVAAVRPASGCQYRSCSTVF